VRYPGGLYHPRALQFDRLRAQMLEQPNATPEQDRHQVYVYLIKKSRPDALLRDTGGAHSDVLLACGFLCLFNSAFDAVRDEGERRSFVDPFLGDRMGDDEGRYAQGGGCHPTHW
jgi:hypothetical protein